MTVAVSRSSPHTRGGGDEEDDDEDGGGGGARGDNTTASNVSNHVDGRETSSLASEGEQTDEDDEEGSLLPEGVLRVPACLWSRAVRCTTEWFR